MTQTSALEQVGDIAVKRMALAMRRREGHNLSAIHIRGDLLVPLPSQLSHAFHAETSITMNQGQIRTQVVKYLTDTRAPTLLEFLHFIVPILAEEDGGDYTPQTHGQVMELFQAANDHAHKSYTCSRRISQRHNAGDLARDRFSGKETETGDEDNNGAETDDSVDDDNEDGLMDGDVEDVMTAEEGNGSAPEVTLKMMDNIKRERYHLMICQTYRRWNSQFLKTWGLDTWEYEATVQTTRSPSSTTGTAALP
ncbi:hypothetical protein DFS34DRAFT_649505 [Phlyctochytrium arcticum]|nr:hypothetical protein DFS34DRAFT_649505 [Phlyctochytrium arcticum]